jgi:hypothetical protein
MNLARDIVLEYSASKKYLEHRNDKSLILNGSNYRIRPDDAFYQKDCVIAIEYESNKRPVESISKYFWLFENTDWLKNTVTIHLLFIITNPDLSKKYEIRLKSIQILGNHLQNMYPKNFKFRYLDYSEINHQNITTRLNDLFK